MEKPKIVCVGLYRPGTGFTRVLTEIAKGLKDNFDVHWVGIGYKGDVIDIGFKIYPCNKEGGDMFGAFKARKLVDELGAKILFLLNDFWMIKNYNVTFKNDHKTYKLAYIPLDGYITDIGETGDLSVLDHIVFYSEFAFNQFKKAMLHSNLPPVNLSIIPHGVDTSKFFPLHWSHETMLEKRKAIFANSKVTPHTKLILNANRYSERKDLETCIHGFAFYLEHYGGEVKLVLHQPGVHPLHREIIENLLKELKITDHVIVNPYGDDNYLSDEDLNVLFNLCDIGINTSLGEGWGMISFEHGACRKPQIVPDHTVFPELWANSALFLEVSKDVRLGNNPFLMKRSAVESVATMINALVSDHELYNDFAEKAYINAKNGKYSWEIITKMWSQVFNSCLQ